MFKIITELNEDTGIYDINFVLKLPEKYKAQYEHFFSLYEIADMQPNKLHTWVLKPKKERVCRFCKRTHPEVTFRKKAHIIPELMGRSKLVSDYECDTCNQLFSNYETDLSYFIGATRSLSARKAKEGVPTYKSVDKKLVIRTEKDEDTGANRLKIESDDFDNRILIDEVGKKVTIIADRPSFNPLRVYKSLAKILLTLLAQEEFDQYVRIRLALQDLNEEQHLLTGCPLCRVMVYVNPGPEFPSPLAFVMQKKDAKDKVPTHGLVLYFANYIYQIFLPFGHDDHWLYDGKTEFMLNTAAPMVDEAYVKKFGEPKFFNVDLSKNELVKKQQDEIVLSFTSIHYPGAEKTI